VGNIRSDKNKIAFHVAGDMLTYMTDAGSGFHEYELHIPGDSASKNDLSGWG